MHKNKLNIIDNCKVVHKQTLSMVRHTLSPLHGKLGTGLMAELLEAVIVTLSATQIQCSLTKRIYQSLCIIQHNYQHTTGCSHSGFTVNTPGFSESWCLQRVCVQSPTGHPLHPPGPNLRECPCPQAVILGKHCCHGNRGKVAHKMAVGQ